MEIVTVVETGAWWCFCFSERGNEGERTGQSGAAPGFFGFSVIDGPKQGREWEKRLMKERKNGG